MPASQTLDSIGVGIDDDAALGVGAVGAVTVGVSACVADARFGVNDSTDRNVDAGVAAAVAVVASVVIASATERERDRRLKPFESSRASRARPRLSVHRVGVPT